MPVRPLPHALQLQLPLPSPPSALAFPHRSTCRCTLYASLCIAVIRNPLTHIVLPPSTFDAFTTTTTPDRCDSRLFTEPTPLRSPSHTSIYPPRSVYTRHAPALAFASTRRLIQRFVFQTLLTPVQPSLSINTPHPPAPAPFDASSHPTLCGHRALLPFRGFSIFKKIAVKRVAAMTEVNARRKQERYDICYGGTRRLGAVDGWREERGTRKTSGITYGDTQRCTDGREEQRHCLTLVSRTIPYVVPEHCFLRLRFPRKSSLSAPNYGASCTTESNLTRAKRVECAFRRRPHWIRYANSCKHPRVLGYVSYCSTFMRLPRSRTTPPADVPPRSPRSYS